MPAIRPFRRTLARLLVHLYPRPWRDRYAAELREVLRTRPVTWSELVDLLWCGFAEWTRLERGRREGIVALAQRAAIALAASLVFAVAASAIGMTSFLCFVALGRLWLGTDVLEVVWIFLRSGWPHDNVVWIALSLYFAGPVAALCLLSGVGRRYPEVARLLTMASFASFTAWAPRFSAPFVPYAFKIAIAVGTGWVLASILFPRVHAPTQGVARSDEEGNAQEASPRTPPVVDRRPKLFRAQPAER